MKTKTENTVTVAANLTDADISNLFNVKSFDVVNKPSDKVKKQQVVEKILQEGVALAKQHESYKTDFVARGNKALYDMLTNIYAYALRVDASPLKEQIIEGMRSELKDKHEIKTTSNTPWMTTVVKMVVRTDRQTASNYSRALRVAFESDVGVDELAGYIERRGGITKVTRTEAAVNEARTKREGLQHRIDMFREALIGAAMVKGECVEIESPIVQFSVKPATAKQTKDSKESSNDTGSFAIVLTYYDTFSKSYKVASTADFGRKFEDVILRHMAARITTSTETFEKAIDRFNDIMAERWEARRQSEDAPAIAANDAETTEAA